MTPTQPVTVVIADDQRVVREGLVLMLGLVEGVDVVAAGADGAEAVALVERHHPDVLLVDIRMPGTDGVEATRRVRAMPDPPAVVMLTTFDDRASILAAMSAGALGYLTKDAEVDTIVAAIRSAAAGDAVLHGAVQASLVEAALGRDRSGPPTSGPPTAGLTNREVEVLRLIAAGRSNREIARTLFVSEATVKTHVNHVLTKISVRDRAQAVAWAYREGLV